MSSEFSWCNVWNDIEMLVHTLKSFKSVSHYITVKRSSASVPATSLPLHLPHALPPSAEISGLCTQTKWALNLSSTQSLSLSQIQARPHTSWPSYCTADASSYSSLWSPSTVHLKPLCPHPLPVLDQFTVLEWYQVRIILTCNSYCWRTRVYAKVCIKHVPGVRCIHKSTSWRRNCSCNCLILARDETTCICVKVISETLI